MCLCPKVFIANLVTSSFPGSADLTVQKLDLIFYQDNASKDNFMPVTSKTKTGVLVFIRVYGPRNKS